MGYTQKNEYDQCNTMYIKPHTYNLRNTQLSSIITVKPTSPSVLALIRVRIGLNYKLLCETLILPFLTCHFHKI